MSKTWLQKKIENSWYNVYTYNVLFLVLTQNEKNLERLD